MKLTEAKLKELILEVVEDHWTSEVEYQKKIEKTNKAFPSGIVDLLNHRDPDTTAMAVHLLQDIHDDLPWAQGLEIETIPNDWRGGFRIKKPDQEHYTQDEIHAGREQLIGLAMETLGLVLIGIGPQPGIEAAPYVDVEIIRPPSYYEEEEIDYEGGEDAPYDDGSGEWKSNVRPKW